jgi:light-regulated signal transduction histidine kinase (bacteriophytochrome)
METVTTFLGYLEQDLRQGNNERITIDMDFIRKATQKMSRLLDDLLEINRAGRISSPSVEMNLVDIIREALNGVAGAISKRGVDVRVMVPSLTLIGDRMRLEEVWQNLIENAVKYIGDQPSPRIEIGAELQGTDTVFFIRDNGMGLGTCFRFTLPLALTSGTIATH